MASDPLMPSFRRFPRDPETSSGSDERPSPVRPFVLRRAQIGGVVGAKHRTPATRTPHPTPTTSDGKNPTTKTDYHYTPDD